MARKTAKQPSSSLQPFYVVLGVVAVVGVALVLWQMGGRGSPALQPVPVVISDEELSRVQGISIGRDDAPVVIYEFADFQCPGCGQFATFTAPLIKERLVDTGQVRYVYYDFPLTQMHQHAFLASRAGRCANDQGRFWDYHDNLYGRQPSWSSLPNATNYFITLADEIGLDEGQFSSCLRSDAHQEEISRNMQLGQMLGVQGTPTLFVNMKRLGGVPDFAELQQIVQAEMGAAPVDPAASGL